MSISTIVLLIIFLVIPLFSKAKKTLDEQTASMGGDASSDKEEGVFMEEEEEPQSEASPYFTYEADNENTYRPRRAAKDNAPAAAPVMSSYVEEPARQQFDLRQAVISQVILNNKYIDEINQ